MLPIRRHPAYRTRFKCQPLARARSCAGGNWALIPAFLCLAFAVGCHHYHSIPETIGQRTECVDSILCEIQANNQGSVIAETDAAPPVTLRSAEQIESAEFREMSLQEALAIALENRSVLKDLGASVLRTPRQVQTDYTESLQRLNPQVSVEAALSAFDTQFYAFGKWQNNDRRFNNRFFGGGANAFKQDSHDYVFQLTKRTPTGAQFSLRSVTDYDANNATGNLTDSAWQTQLHAEARQPLLQGGGLQFNRIAGPAAQPGVYNGVLIAKVDSEITSAAFEQGIRDYVSNVINAYWDLYFAYRDADAKRDAMLRSERTWKSYDAQKSSHRKSGPAEALAREQYFRFRSEYQDAVAGKPSLRTQNNNASTGGAFAGVGGIQAAERRLRLILGMTISDGLLIRPE